MGDSSADLVSIGPVLKMNGEVVRVAAMAHDFLVQITHPPAAVTASGNAGGKARALFAGDERDIFMTLNTDPAHTGDVTLCRGGSANGTTTTFTADQLRALGIDPGHLIELAASLSPHERARAARDPFLNDPPVAAAAIIYHPEEAPAVLELRDQARAIAASIGKTAAQR